MTKTLLINCYLDSNKIAELRDALGKFTVCRVVPYTSIGPDYQMPASDISAVVISGSEARIVEPEDRAKFEGVIQFIRSCKVPLLGVCFGHQLLCAAYGAKNRNPANAGLRQVRASQNHPNRRHPRKVPHGPNRSTRRVA